MTNATNTLTARQRALSELVLLALMMVDDKVVRDESRGRTTRLLVRMCGIPDTDTNRTQLTIVLNYLQKEGFIDRDRDPSGKLTYKITLKEYLSPGKVTEIMQRRAQIQKQFRKDADPDLGAQTDFDEVEVGCELAYQAILKATAEARREANGGNIATNLTEILATVGIWSGRGREIRYYLRLLGLIESIESCDDGTKRWWWKITEATLDVKALKQLVETQPFATRDTRRQRNGRRGASLNGAVTTRRISEEPPSGKGGEPRSVEVVVESNSDALLKKLIETATLSGNELAAALLAIIAELEADKAELKRQLAARPQVSEDIRAVLARYAAERG